jgi:hypothetical protein
MAELTPTTVTASSMQVASALECRPLAQSGSSLMRGFAAGVSSKADIDAAVLTLRRGRRRHPREGGDLLAAP